MAQGQGSLYELKSVFINCPFTADYRLLLEATVFAVVACGFRPRSALEAGSSGDVRLDKIARLIKESSYSIHDISAVQLDAVNNLPRFNMPFELGIAVGLKKFGGRRYSSHSLLVLESNKYTYQKCLSDIAGQDAQAHDGRPAKLIELVRNWLRTESKHPGIPGGRIVADEFTRFDAMLPEICIKAGLTREDLPYVELLGLAQAWLEEANSRA